MTSRIVRVILPLFLRRGFFSNLFSLPTELALHVTRHTKGAASHARYFHTFEGSLSYSTPLHGTFRSTAHVLLCAKLDIEDVIYLLPGSMSLQTTTADSLTKIGYAMRVQ